MGSRLIQATSESGQDTVHLKCDGPGCRAEKTFVPGRGSWGAWAIVVMPATGQESTVCSVACAEDWLQTANAERIRVNLRAIEEVGV